MSPANSPKLRIFGCPTTVSLWESLALEPEVYKTLGADQLTALTQSACGLPETIELSLPPENSNPCQEIWIIPSPAQIAAGDSETRDQRVARWCDWMEEIQGHSDLQQVRLLSDVVLNIDSFVASIWGDITLLSATKLSIERTVAQIKLIESLASQDEECVTVLAGIYDDAKLKTNFLSGKLMDYNATETAWQVQHLLHAVTEAQCEFDRVNGEILSAQREDAARLEAQWRHETDELQQQLTDKSLEQRRLEQALQQTQQEVDQTKASHATSLEQLKARLTTSETDATRMNDLLASQSGEIEVSELQIAQLQEELEAALDAADKQQKTALASMDELKAELTAREADITRMNDLLASQSGEIEVSELQIAQLQEELEAALDAADKQQTTALASMDELKAELTAREADITRMNDLLASQSGEIEVSELQIAQLQEELEAALDAADKQQTTALASMDELKAELTAREADITRMNDLLASQSGEIEVSELQIAQLQEELETALDAADKQQKANAALALDQEQQIDDLITQIQGFEVHCQKLEDEVQDAVASREAALNSANDREELLNKLSDQHQHLETEQEINALQVAQLQEELELTFDDLATNTRMLSASTQLLNKNVAAQTATPQYKRLEIFDWLNSEGYREAKVQWTEVAWQGEIVDLTAKVVLRDFETQIEIRPEGVKAINLDWADTPSDEFGPYLLIKTSDLDRHPLLQALVAAAYVESVSQMDFGAAAAEDEHLLKLLIADAFFASQPERQPRFAEKDTFQIDEHYEVEGYQHIAGTLSSRTNLASSAMRLKLCALGGAPDNDVFEGRLDLEIREADGIAHTLPNWPYPSSDEFGPLLRLTCDFKGPLTRVTTEVELDQMARGSIAQLVLMIPNLIALASTAEGVETAVLTPWQRLIGSMFSDQQTCLVSGLEPSKTQILRPYEIVAQPGYAHVAFAFLSETVECVVKAQALHHFSGDTEGEPAVEFRGLKGQSVPLFDSQFVETDEHGDLVCLRLSELEPAPPLNVEGDIEDKGVTQHSVEPVDWAEAAVIIRMIQAHLRENPVQGDMHLPDSGFWDRGLDQILSRMPTGR